VVISQFKQKKGGVVSVLKTEGDPGLVNTKEVHGKGDINTSPFGVEASSGGIRLPYLVRGEKKSATRVSTLLSPFRKGKSPTGLLNLSAMGLIHNS